MRLDEVPDCAADEPEVVRLGREAPALLVGQNVCDLRGDPGRVERRVDGLQGLFKVLLVLWDAGVPFLPPDPRPDQLLELLGGNSIEIF